MNDSRTNGVHSPVSPLSIHHDLDFLDRIPIPRSPTTKSASSFNMDRPTTFWPTNYENSKAPEVNQNPYSLYLGQPSNAQGERYQLHDLKPQATGNTGSIQPDSQHSETPRYVANTAEVNYFRPGKNYRNHYRLSMIAAIIFLIVTIVLSAMLSLVATKLRNLQNSAPQITTLPISASTLLSTLSTTGTVTTTATKSIPTKIPTTIVSTVVPMPISVTRAVTERVTITETSTTFPPFLVTAVCSLSKKTSWTFVVECERGKGACKTISEHIARRTAVMAYPTGGIEGVGA
ncbi:hypothetical protein BJ875DRAFT_542328 [Amylocarpus encephaloides]|uniref:Uncharacterized protein n=1 Tax=Amylocarpus encephaloides TaxID=45428 RepID=A0A9P7YKG8_9HELO|nr:hypothetical protein BJ875DRAFT_542328 [Amylocarpus encephaloides]